MRVSHLLVLLICVDLNESLHRHLHVPLVTSSLLLPSWLVFPSVAASTSGSLNKRRKKEETQREREKRMRSSTSIHSNVCLFVHRVIDIDMLLLDRLDAGWFECCNEGGIEVFELQPDISVTAVAHRFAHQHTSHTQSGRSVLFPSSLPPVPFFFGVDGCDISVSLYLILVMGRSSAARTWAAAAAGKRSRGEVEIEPADDTTRERR